jgi:hypothetical protein
MCAQNHVCARLRERLRETGLYKGPQPPPSSRRQSVGSVGGITAGSSPILAVPASAGTAAPRKPIPQRFLD